MSAQAKKSDRIGGNLCTVLRSGTRIRLHSGRKDLTYEGESVYNYLQVSEDDTSVRLSTNVLFGVQSVYMKQTGDRHVL
mgnify:CR=1 FL=1